MRRVALASGAALVAGAIACGVISIPAEPIAPVNGCADNASCARSFPDASVTPQCFGGACVGGSAFHPIVVVSVPENPQSLVLAGGGVSFALPDTYQATRVSLESVAPLCNPDVECDFVPPLATIDPLSTSGGGSLRVSDAFGVTFFPPGLRPNQPPPPPPNPIPPTSLPIHAVFRPMWVVDATSNTAILARKLGLPLEDRQATIRQRLSTSAGPLLGPTASPKAVPGFAFGAAIPQPLAPTDPSGTYEIVVTPDPPFDIVPPFIADYPIPVAAAGLAGLGLDISGFVQVYDYDLIQNVPKPPVFEADYTVSSAAGAPSLGGWKLHIDRADGTRISGVVTLGAGATQSVKVLWATGTADQTGQTLYIDPPPGLDLPRYIAPAVGSSIFGPFEYPALPPPITASGFVRRATDDALTTAQIVFFASGDPQAYVVEADDTTVAKQLLYEKQIATTPEAQFATPLPAGVLRAYVIPDDPTLALTASTLSLDPTGPSAQSGKTLFVNPRGHVRGRVVLPDGTPVYGADVVVDASADAPFSTDDPRLRPRESSGTTDPSGVFDVLSDPGLVDISIRPHDGTRLPWVVLTNRTVLPSIPGDAGTDGGLTLANDVVVGLPTPFTQSAPTGVLTDTAGAPLPFAVVRAYAFPAPIPVDGGTPTPRGARLIGSTATDASGAFQLYLLPPE